MMRYEREAVQRQRPTMKRRDIERVARHLRTMLGTPRIHLHEPAYRGATVQVLAGDVVVGTCVPDNEDGEKAWAVTLILFDAEMPP